MKVSVTECYSKNSHFPLISVPLPIAFGYKIMSVLRNSEFSGLAKGEVGTALREVAALAILQMCIRTMEEMAIVGINVFYSMKFPIIRKSV